MFKETAALVVDVGANRGDFSRQVLEATHLKVVAIEPSPMRVSELRTLGKLYPGHIKVFACGVGRVRGKRTLFEVGRGGAGSTFAPEVLEIDYLSDQIQGEVLREIRSIDDILVEVMGEIRWNLPIALLKIDVEGLKDEALDGSTETITSIQPYAIQFEGNWHQLFRGTTVRELANFAPE